MPESDQSPAKARPFWLASLVALAALACMSANPPIATADDAKLKAYGQHLARECTSCHRLDGVDNGIPSIISWPPDSFIAAMKFYRDGARINPVMVSVASSLSDEQLNALAVFFASVPKPAKKNAPQTEKKSGK
jgi:cytochrome c553